MIASGRVAAIRILLILSLGYAFSGASRGQSGATDLERFQLYSGCQPIAVEVRLSGEASEIGLTVPLVAAVAEGHLRAVGLLGRFDLETDVPFLSIDVTVLGETFHMELLYNKAVIDLSTGMRGHSPMWGRGVTRAHRQTAKSVITAIEVHVKQFLAYYRHVNQSACDDAMPTQSHTGPSQ